MSPIIELQRRAAEVGRVRSGEKGPKGEPRKLDKWRLTSRDRQRLDSASVLWGGEVREWETQWELYTETDVLPIMLTPESEASLWYESWSRGGCQRRCDGVTEMLSDSPCMCDEDDRECKPSLRFSVILPDLPGLGMWLVQSHGINAAREIPGALHLLSGLTARGELVPARLRLEQRSDVKNGKTRRFAVPVIDIDVSMRQLLGQPASLVAPETAALPAGYTPVPAGNGHGVSLAEGLAQAETQEVTRTSRSAAPIPTVDDDIEFGTAPVPVEESGASSPQAPAAPQIHKENIAALNALIGQLREEGAITTRQLWVSVARMRKKPVDEMIDMYGGLGDDGDLHWSPLRQLLRPDEAVELRKRLGRLWAETQDDGA